MSSPKVMQYLKLKTQIRTLVSRNNLRFLGCMSLSVRSQPSVHTAQVCFFSRRYLSNRDKAKAYATANEDDYFGAEHHFAIADKEHADAKEAWLKSLENPDLKSKYEAAKETKQTETEKFESDVVKELVESWKERSQPKEHTVMRNYGRIRYDKETPAEVKELSRNIQKTKKGSGEIVENKGMFLNHVQSHMQQSERNGLTNRFTVDSMRSQRRSLRKSGQQFEIHKMVSQIGGLNRNRHAKLQQNTEKDNEQGLSYIEDQYFQHDREDVQLSTFPKSVAQSRQSEKSLKTSLRLDKNLNNINDRISSDRSETDSRKDTDLSYIDQQYFLRETDRNDQHSAGIELERNSTRDGKGRSKFQFNDKERQPRTIGVPNKVKATKKMKPETFSKYESHFGSEYIDEQYFGYKTDKGHKKDLKSSSDSEKETVKNKKTDDVEEYLDSKKDRNQSKREKKGTVTTLTTEADINSGALKMYEERRRSNLTEKKPKIQEKNVKKPETAEEAAIRMRAELEEKSGMRLFGRINAKKVDQKGFRILSGQVPDFTNAPAQDIVGVLKNNIVYDDNDIVAINKPYGLSSRRGPGSRVSIDQLVGDLMPETRLHLVSGIGKETTGVLLLAKTPEMAEKLRDALKKEDTVKRYLVVTKNVPKLIKGEINIPIGDGMIDGKVRKKLKPYGDSDMGISSRLSKNAEEAVTRYEVLARQDSWALIECWPLTNVKHQIRAHLALGLNCPILGDHKYSHFHKIAPMKLHGDMLEKLKVRQSKVRDIAMHIHGTAVIIPGFLDGQNLIVTAPLPPHFIKNMKSLNLKMPPGKYY